MLAVLALLAPAHATDVLFLDATPVAVDDFSIAGLFTSMVVAAAEERGLAFEDADAIRAWAGADADTCWDVEACPANLWDRTGARLAVVMSVGKRPEGLAIGVRLHGVDETAPFKTFEEIAAPGQESVVAAKIARAAADALPLLPARKPMGGPVLVLEDEVILAPDEVAPDGGEADPADGAGDRADAGRGEDGGEDGRAERGGDARGDRGDEGRDGDTRTGRDRTRAEETAIDAVLRERFEQEDEQRAMGVPAWAYERYRESGLSKKEWLQKARVRAGHGFLELGGGWGIGDVSRNYGVRVRIAEAGGSFETIGTTTIEGARVGEAPTFGVTLGYAPAWFLDTSVALSFQYGRKYLDTGWECPDRCETSESTDDYEVGAVQGVIEPRLRLYPVATGVVKPYGLLGFTVVVHDAFEVPDTDFVDYPDAPAGASFGPTGGLGIAVDIVSRVSLYGEVPATLLVSQPETFDEGEVDLEPLPFERSSYIVRFVGGIAVRL